MTLLTPSQVFIYILLIFISIIISLHCKIFTPLSRTGSLRTGVTSPGPGPASSLSSTNIRASSLSSNTLPRTKSTNMKNDKNDDIPSYMKPTAARAKKVLGTTNSDSQQNLRKASVGRMTTSSRVTPVGPRPSRR